MSHGAPAPEEDKKEEVASSPSPSAAPAEVTSEAAAAVAEVSFTTIVSYLFFFSLPRKRILASGVYLYHEILFLKLNTAYVVSVFRHKRF